MSIRVESDALGEREIPQGVYWGVHTLRALENFPLSGLRWPGEFIVALAQVKRACAETNAVRGDLPEPQAGALIAACREMEAGALHEHVVVDPLQGGAGTSTNMNLNEVLANRASEMLGAPLGSYAPVHPLAHVNMHQSTNDVFPTALKVAGLRLLLELEAALARLQESMQEKERAFADVLKVGRTQLRDAVPMTLGMEFGAYAEAVARDRWRIFKCRERIKQVNLGGTAVGTGLGAPRDYVLRVVGHLGRVTGLPVSRAENLVDATQNMDCFVEAMGMLSALAANLLKIANDIRLLSSGPDCGLGEVDLPPLQAGSSIMAGKINPVLPEAVAQVALKVMASGQTVTLCAGLGQLDLNHLMPLLAHEFLDSVRLLRNAVRVFEEKCLRGLQARPRRCRELVDSSAALATVLVPALGYELVEAVLRRAEASGTSVAQTVQDMGLADAGTIEELLSPRRMRKLGFSLGEYAGLRAAARGPADSVAEPEAEDTETP
ncbi:aspartate ammonia-lyase [Desulfocurvus sp.]|uniref:aspartate ammonia-lyase n=1 Tax=Desulfocurvus sp. TaxID=2871698 RepID=UPI0025C0FDBD|nr:aspartate ammonia-lyase [Desulfocurvus sp.]MCK9239809.1 aspartate ammonia-lyase [Desulfocurvus sp.]